MADKEDYYYAVSPIFEATPSTRILMLKNERKFISLILYGCSFVCKRMEIDILPPSSASSVLLLSTTLQFGYE